MKGFHGGEGWGGVDSYCSIKDVYINTISISELPIVFYCTFSISRIFISLELAYLKLSAISLMLELQCSAWRAK